MNLACIESQLFVVSKIIGVSVYDFDFNLHFNVQHPIHIDGENLCVLRVGSISNYLNEYSKMLGMGLRLVNSPEEYLLASELEFWYPLIKELTPRTQLYDELPTVEEVEANFSWPVFIKGSRQTSKHNIDLSVVQNADQYQKVIQEYKSNPILHWQKAAIREFVNLQPVDGEIQGKIKPSMEYRSFWWFGKCVGCGCYWSHLNPYHATDLDVGLKIAQAVALRVKVPFLVVDFAKTVDDTWIVIECNDGQESGNAGVSPILLWRNILEHINGIFPL